MPDDPLFSRSGVTLSLGSCDTELKTLVPPVIHDEFVTLATLRRLSKSEALRDLVIAYVRGEMELARMRQHPARSEGLE